MSDPGMTHDLLREIGSIGSAHAATALGILLQKPIAMNVPTVAIVNFDALASALGGPEVEVACAFLRVTGDVAGNLFVVLPVAAARAVLDGWFALSKETAWSDMELSALGELGNILAGAYLGSLADLTGMSLLPSTPLVAVDMAQAVLTEGVFAAEPPGNCALLIQTELHARDSKGGAHVLFLPDPGAETAFLRALGVANWS